MKKIFGGINLSWKKLIIFAILAAIYTALMAIIPIAEDTSFEDITISFEVWILFGIIIIMNSKSAKDSALKCFIFFLISQPLIYLIQVPFSPMGWELFIHYRYWFNWTLLTIPMGFIGYYMKKDKWWGLVILAPMLLFLGGHYTGFLKETMYSFPFHLLSTLFCLVTMIIYPLYIFKDKKVRITGLIISIIIIITLTIISVKQSGVTYDTILFASDEESELVFDDTYNAYLEDNKIGKIFIEYDDGLEAYIMRAKFKKAGKTTLILEDKNGNKTIFEINVKRDKYDIKKKSSNNKSYANNAQLNNWNKDNVTMNIKEISEDKTSALLVVEDKNENPTSLNTYYSIQRLSEAGVWYDLKSNATVEQLMKTMVPNENGITEIELDWSNLYGELKIGTYRIVKDKDFITLYSEPFEIK